MRAMYIALVVMLVLLEGCQIASHKPNQFGFSQVSNSIEPSNYVVCALGNCPVPTPLHSKHTRKSPHVKTNSKVHKAN